MPTRKIGVDGSVIVIPNAHVTRVYVSPWMCPTCLKSHNEINEVYISYNGHNFDCSKCFRAYLKK